MQSAIAIIGAGECGVAAAFALREFGYGGRIDLFGDEPHVPYERPPLSKGTGPEALKPIRAEADYSHAGIHLHSGVTVAAIHPKDHAIELAGGSFVHWDKLLIATGARARVLPGMERALTLRTHDDAERIFATIRPGTRLVILGGGFIGLELAATASRAGASVSVVEAAHRLMERAVPEAVAARIEKRHREAGIAFILGEKVSSVADDHVTLASGRRLEAQVVVAGVGAVPNVGLAEAAGLEVGNGIIVDACFHTSAKDVFAAGDCCSFPHHGKPVRLESWRVSQEQGRHAARAMLGDETPFTCVPWFWSDQHDLGLQVAGLHDQARNAVQRLEGEALVEFQFDSDGRLACAAGVGPGNTVAKSIRIAEKLIAAGARPDPAVMASADTDLKKLLKEM